MRKHFDFVALAGLSVLSACTAPNAQIAGLYKRAVCQTGKESAESAMKCSDEPDAVASLVTIETQPATPPTTGTTLLERAQAEYIRALEKWSKSAKDLRESLAEKVAATEASSADERTFKRTLILDIRKEGAFNPVDRLESVRIAIKLTNAQFTNWDTAATNYTTINAGTAQLTNTVGSSGGLTVGTPSVAPVSASLTGNLSQSSSRVENYTESFQLENLTVSVDSPLNPNNESILRIQRQGGPGVDLTGAVVVKLEIFLPAQTERTTYAADKLFSSNGQPIAPNKVKLSARTHSVPDLAHLSSAGSLLAGC